jgi:hypothetical protein
LIGTEKIPEAGDVNPKAGRETMGKFMGPDDIYIEYLFELLNIRFSPTPVEAPDDVDNFGKIPNPSFGGIEEIVELQRDFQIFQLGRTFERSIAILNLGGQWNARVRNRWYALLADLVHYGSNVNGMNGNDAIVSSLIKNLGEKRVLPVYFKAHDSRKKNKRIVIVGDEPKPIFYIDQEYLTISLPMKPAEKIERPAKNAAGPRPKRSR